MINDDIEIGTTLNLQIHYAEPIELGTLATSLNALGLLYKEFVENHEPASASYSRLCIVQMEVNAHYMDVFLRQDNLLLNTASLPQRFINYMQHVWDYLLGCQKMPPLNISEQTLKNMSVFVDIIAKDGRRDRLSFRIADYCPAMQFV